MLINNLLDTILIKLIEMPDYIFNSLIILFSVYLEYYFLCLMMLFMEHIKDLIRWKGLIFFLF